MWYHWVSDVFYSCWHLPKIGNVTCEHCIKWQKLHNPRRIFSPRWPNSFVLIRASNSWVERHLQPAVVTVENNAYNKKIILIFIISKFSKFRMYNNFEDMFKVCIFVDVLCCTIALCVVMLIVQVEIIVEFSLFISIIGVLLILIADFFTFSQSKDIIDPGVSWKSSALFFCVFGLVFLSCEIGQRLTDTFDEIYRKFKKSAWYLFPIEVQRMLPTILIGVQETIVFDCFGILDISREQFKKVNTDRCRSIVWLYVCAWPVLLTLITIIAPSLGG